MRLDVFFLELLGLQHLGRDLAQRHDGVLVAVAIHQRLGAAGKLAGAETDAARTRSKRLGILSTQSSTVTRAMEVLIFQGLSGSDGANRSKAA